MRDEINYQINYIISLFLFIFSTSVSQPWTSHWDVICRTFPFALWYKDNIMIWYDMMINQPSLISYLTLIKTGKFNRFFPSHSSNGVKENQSFEMNLRCQLWYHHLIHLGGGDWKIDVSPYKWDEMRDDHFTKYPSHLIYQSCSSSPPTPTLQWLNSTLMVLRTLIKRDSEEILMVLVHLLSTFKQIKIRETSWMRW